MHYQALNASQDLYRTLSLPSQKQSSSINVSFSFQSPQSLLHSPHNTEQADGTEGLRVLYSIVQIYILPTKPVPLARLQTVPKPSQPHACHHSILRSIYNPITTPYTLPFHSGCVLTAWLHEFNHYLSSTSLQKLLKQRSHLENGRFRKPLMHSLMGSHKPCW